MYSLIASFVFTDLQISPPQKLRNSIFFPFIICSLSISSLCSLSSLSFFTKSPIIFKISLSKSNKLNGFGLSSVSFDIKFLLSILFDITILFSILYSFYFSSSFIKLYKSLNTFLAAISKELLFVEFIL